MHQRQGAADTTGNLERALLQAVASLLRPQPHETADVYARLPLCADSEPRPGQVPDGQWDITRPDIPRAKDGGSDSAADFGAGSQGTRQQP